MEPFPITVGNLDEFALKLEKQLISLAVDVASPGRPIAIDWQPVPGATKAEVLEASVMLLGDQVRETTASVPFSVDGNGFVVNVPSGRRVRALGLQGLKEPEGSEITSSNSLGNLKLVIQFPNGSGWDHPRFAIPPVSASGMRPATLTGARYSNRTLDMTPAIAASKLRLSLVTGGLPSDFTQQPVNVSTINLTTETPAHNIKLMAPDGMVLWQVPEFDSDSPVADVDIRVPLELALNKRLQEGEIPTAEFRVEADAPAVSVIRSPAVKGALLRTNDGVLRTELKGDPQEVLLGAALASERPSSVVGDLSIKYEGIRIFEQASDSIPSSSEPISGLIVTSGGAVRVFDPIMLEDIQPAYIGVVGRASQACELSIEFVEVVGGLTGRTLGPPATVSVPASTKAIATHWATVPGEVKLHGPVGIRVIARTGSFLWAASPHPLIRVAVADPNPGVRELKINSATLLSIEQIETQLSRFEFPLSAFRNRMPLLSSDLFLTVDISDLIIRYAR